MTEPTPNWQAEQLLDCTTRIVVAQLERGGEPIDIPELAAVIHTALAALLRPAATPPARPEPAVPVNRSIRPDHIVCLEDGRKLKMLKRHLKTAFNLTPDEYRARWNLPADYPMVAPDYAAQRRDLAHRIGLGHSRRQA